MKLINFKRQIVVATGFICALLSAPSVFAQVAQEIDSFGGNEALYLKAKALNGVDKDCSPDSSASLEHLSASSHLLFAI